MEYSTHGERCEAVGVQLKAQVPEQQHLIVITGSFHVDHNISLREVRVHPSGMRASFVQPCTHQQTSERQERARPRNVQIERERHIVEGRQARAGERRAKKKQDKRGRLMNTSAREIHTRGKNHVTIPCAALGCGATGVTDTRSPC